MPLASSIGMTLSDKNNYGMRLGRFRIFKILCIFLRLFEEFCS